MPCRECSSFNAKETRCHRMPDQTPPPPSRSSLNRVLIDFRDGRTVGPDATATKPRSGTSWDVIVCLDRACATDSLEYLASASFGEHRKGSDIPELLWITGTQIRELNIQQVTLIWNFHDDFPDWTFSIFPSPHLKRQRSKSQRRRSLDIFPRGYARFAKRIRACTRLYRNPPCRGQMLKHPIRHRGIRVL